MEDYISILLRELGEQWCDLLGREYYLQQARENYAKQAFLEALTEEAVSDVRGTAKHYSSIS